MSKRCIAVLGALVKEIKPIWMKLREVEVCDFGAYVVREGSLGKWRVVSMVMGVGKVRAAASTQFIADKYRPVAMILVGAAGAILPRLAIGDFVLPRRLFQYDFDITDLALPGYEDEPWVEVDDGLVQIVQEATSVHLNICAILTGDKVVTNPNLKRDLRQKYHADCVDMEGVAFAIICERNSIPFVVIKNISDVADEYSRYSFNHQIERVGHSLADLVSELLSDNEFYLAFHSSEKNK